MEERSSDFLFAVFASFLLPVADTTAVDVGSAGVAWIHVLVGSHILSTVFFHCSYSKRSAGFVKKKRGAPRGSAFPF